MPADVPWPPVPSVPTAPRALCSPANALQVSVAAPKPQKSSKRRRLGDSSVETIEGTEGADGQVSPLASRVSSLFEEEEEEEGKGELDAIDFAAGSDDEIGTSVRADAEVEEVDESMGASPTLDDSIMSHNATLALDSRTPSSAFPFKSVFGPSAKAATSTLKRSRSRGSSTASSPGSSQRELRRLSASILGSALKHDASTPLALHGLTPGNFSPSAFFLDGSPGTSAGLNSINSINVLSMSAVSVTGNSQARTLLSPQLSDLKEVIVHKSTPDEPIREPQPPTRRHVHAYRGGRRAGASSCGDGTQG